MPPIHFNLAQMTKETFEYDNTTVSKETTVDAPSLPGIIYFLEKGKNTFSIKGFVSDNIQKKLGNLHNYKEDYEF